VRGHLRQRGKAWELRAYAGTDPVTGRQKYVTRTFRGGKREAEEALARFTTEVAGGGLAAQDATVADLIHEWLELAKPELSPTTARGYEWITKTYILPNLGRVRLARLKTAQLDRFYARLRESGGQGGKPLSAATVRQTHAILRRALQQGLRWGWIGANPAVLASAPRGRGHQLDPPAPEDVIRLIEAATGVDPDFGCFLLVAATTGSRRGELCGLRWSDVDLTGRTLTIGRSVVEGAGSKILVKDTKTHVSRRIALDETTADVLTEHRRLRELRARACGVGVTENDYVYSDEPDGRKPWVPNDVTKKFIRLRKQVGLEGVRLHDLRHFAATRLLAAGVPVRTVSGRLGHANAATTLGVYAHFLEASDRDAADTLGAVLQAAQGPPAGPPKSQRHDEAPIPISRGRQSRSASRR